MKFRFIRSVPYFIIILLIYLNSVKCFGQVDTLYVYSQLTASQKTALDIYCKSDTISSSPLWPNINPQLFFKNILNNIIYPDKINQGQATNFCSYAALTHVILKYQPETYVNTILSLYRNGDAPLHKKTLRPSKQVRNAAGTLKRKGDLEVHHADQLWFLTLADNFKGYLNLFDKKYNPGDEDNFWAATNYRKFIKMLKKLGNYKVDRTGSDLLRPPTSDMYEYISNQLKSGVVLLYINSKYLHPGRFYSLRMPAPTHFIVLYEMKAVGDMIEMKYWDYGLKTELVISKKRLHKLVFGISKIESQS